jgi:hypothetical protein
MQLELLGTERRDQGIAKVTDNNKAWVEAAREWVIWYAMEYGSVSADDLRRNFSVPDHVHPNAIGAVFRSKWLRRTGFVQSTTPSAHARMIGVYAFNIDHTGE